jgi:hypothetical protein
VEVVGEATGSRPRPRFALAGDVEQLTASDAPDDRVVLLGPFDPYLQLRDRPLLVADEARRKDLWRTLGRPGALLHRGEVAGTWRPRTSGRSLTVAMAAWGRLPTATRAAAEEASERLAAWRGVAFAGVSWD